jgi:two-component system CheB/CheR fusion protein
LEGRILGWSQAEVLEPLRVQRITEDARIVEVSMTATALVNELGQVYALSTTERESKGAMHA